MESEALALVKLEEKIMSTCKVRNPIARSPFLRKGGAHVKSKSSQRFQIKRDVKKAMDEWKKNNGKHF